MILDKTRLRNYTKLESTINNPDGEKTKERIGDVDVKARDTKGVLRKLTFEKVLHLSEYKTNLISVSRSVRKQHELFHAKAKLVLNLRSKENLRLTRRGNFFTTPYTILTIQKGKQTPILRRKWRQMPSKILVQKVWIFIIFRDVANTTDEVFRASDYCEICALGKISKKHVRKVSDNKATQKLEKNYTGVIGPVSPSSKVGIRYAISFTEVFSGYAVINIMKHKTQTLQIFWVFSNFFVPKTGDQKFNELIMGLNPETKLLKNFA